MGNNGMLRKRNEGKGVKVMPRILSYRQRRQRLYLLRRFLQRGMGLYVPVEGVLHRCEAANNLIEFEMLTPRVALLVTSENAFCIAGILQIGVWGDCSSYHRKAGKDV